jgi:hypothetical protein
MLVNLYFVFLLRRIHFGTIVILNSYVNEFVTIKAIFFELLRIHDETLKELRSIFYIHIEILMGLSKSTHCCSQGVQMDKELLKCKITIERPCSVRSTYGAYGALQCHDTTSARVSSLDTSRHQYAIIVAGQVRWYSARVPSVGLCQATLIVSFACNWPQWSDL